MPGRALDLEKASHPSSVRSTMALRPQGLAEPPQGELWRSTQKCCMAERSRLSSSNWSSPLLN
jgi:hypothetical protein